MAIITGPNMAGKSTYMRQVALIVLMGQMGCFVPARSSGNWRGRRNLYSSGRFRRPVHRPSTFMVEMNEVAHVLKNRTSDSLILLDEIGRGTSTFDG